MIRLRPEAIEQTLADFVSAVVFGDFFAHQEDVRIALQFFGERFVERLAISDFSHALRSVRHRCNRKVFRAAARGLSSANLHTGQSGLLRLLVHLVELLVRQLSLRG